jgi:aminopeptidase YwaD
MLKNNRVLALLLTVVLGLSGCISRPPRSNEQSSLSPAPTQEVSILPSPSPSQEVSISPWPSSSQEASNSPTPSSREKADSPDEALDMLTSDAFEGRLSGSEGNRKAGAYLAEQFFLIGLQPFDEDYYHEYTQRVLDFSQQKSEITLYMTDGSHIQLENGADYLQFFDGTPITAEGTITFDLDDKAMSEKIFVTDKSADIALADLNKAKAIFYKDANFNRMSTIAEDVGMKKTPLIKIIPEVYQRLKAGEVEKVSISIVNQGLDATVSNVIGIIPGKDHNKAVVLSAHYDHVGRAGELIYRGAVDNASGVTVLLDIAQKLSNTPSIEFEMDIIICAFNGEEAMLKGSDAFVAHLLDTYESVYNINFDCLGVIQGGDLLITGDKDLSYNLYLELEKILKEDGFTCKWAHMGGISDYVSFLEENISSVNLSNEILKQIHSPKDTTDQVDVAYLEALGDSIVRFLILYHVDIFGEEM